MRIVIVEDEAQIRNGLQRLVERIHPENQVVGVAGNGVVGLTKIKELRPDVVITDVRMPDMDGLEMIGALQASGVKPQYIIISAFSEFSYAKKAMSFGVSEYLLKPVSMEELSQSLKKAELQLQLSSMREQITSPESAIRSLFWKGNTVDKEALKMISEEYGLDKQFPFAQVLLYFGSNYDVAKNSINRLTIQKFQNECTQVYTIPLEAQRAILYILSGVENKQHFIKWLTNSVSIHQHTLWKDVDIALAFCNDLFSIYPTAMAMLNAMSWKISLPREPVLRYPEVLATQTAHCAFPIEIENRLRAAICAQNIDRVQQQVSLFMRYFSGITIYAPQEIKESYTRFLWTALNLAKEMGFTSDADQLETRRMMESILNAQNLNELNLVTEQLLAVLTEQIADSGPSEQNITIIRAKSLIHEFYSSGITLEEIAQKLSITPEYLSTQFRKETGETFSAYIRNYRISKAKGMLISTDLKLHQIAKLVGYADAKYFGQVFKRCTGQLPADYRRSHK